MRARHQKTSLLPGMQIRDYVVIDDYVKLLLPEEARQLAKQLCQAANKAEQKQNSVELYKMFDG